MRLRYLAVLALSAQASLGAHPSHPPPSRVPFKFYRGYQIVVKGSVGRLRDLNFLIDTGAFPTVLDRKVARRLGLESQRAQLQVQGASLSVDQVQVPHLDVGPVCRKALPAAVRDLYFIQQRTGLRVDVLLGVDILAHYDFSIDFKSRTLSFESGEPPGTLARLKRGCPFPIVQVEVEGRMLNLLVDTAARDLILYRGRCGQLPGVDLLPPKTLLHLGGQSRAYPLELGRFRLGPGEWRNLRAYSLEVPSGYLPHADGILGVRTLGIRRVRFDFPAATFSWH